MQRIGTIIIGLLLASNAMAQVRFAPPQIPPGMKGVEGKYHFLIHDLTPEEETEVLIRMQAMVDEYIDRTRDFSGRLNQKLPFFLFRRREDYVRNGGIPGSAGVFTGSALMAIAGDKITNNTWHTIQHEGFHQFAAAVIGGDMPIWVNEGLAEYFGEAVYTGDGFISGAIPKPRLQRIQKLIEGKQFKSIQNMMSLTHQQWNRELNVTNYDQAWAMTMYLAHGEDGKYQNPFSRFMVNLNRGKTWQNAWADTFGNAVGFEEQFNAWWTSEDRDASVDVYARATAQMLTSYLARAASQKQTFSELEPLLEAIEKKQIKWNKSEPLPDSLAIDCIDLSRVLIKRGVTIALTNVPISPSSKITQQAVVCTLKDGTQITGTYKVKGSRIGSINTEVVKPKSDVKPGKK